MQYAFHRNVASNAFTAISVFVALPLQEQDKLIFEIGQHDIPQRSTNKASPIGCHLKFKLYGLLHGSSLSLPRQSRTSVIGRSRHRVPRAGYRQGLSARHIGSPRVVGCSTPSMQKQIFVQAIDASVAARNQKIQSLGSDCPVDEENSGPTRKSLSHPVRNRSLKPPHS